MEELQLFITEQPCSTFLFRYCSELNGAHGHIAGEHSKKSNRTLPKVALRGWSTKEPVFIRCTLAADDDENHEHPNLLVRKLERKKEAYEPHLVELNLENNWEAEFKVGIIHKKKKDAADILTEKIIRRRQETGMPKTLTSKEKIKITREAKDQAATVNLESVKLRFEAVDAKNLPITGSNGLPLIVFSRPIRNPKCAANRELKIIKASLTAGSCRGNSEVMLFVDKVDKKDIKVRFFQEDEQGMIIWQDFAKFDKADVHHQYGIAFNTPPYQDQSIEGDVEVMFELFRPTDDERSEPLPFVYRPAEECPGKKRKIDIDEDLNLVASKTTNSLTQYFQEVFTDTRASQDDSGMVSSTNQYQFAADPLYAGEAFEMDIPIIENPFQIIELDEFDWDESLGIAHDGVKRSLGISNIMKRFEPKSMQQKVWSAVLNDDLDMLKIILKSFERQKTTAKSLLKATDDSGRSAVHMVAETGNVEMLQVLMDLDIDATVPERSGGKTPLHLAARRGHEAVVNLLVQEAASSVDTRDWKGQTALHYAASAGWCSICETLLDAESDAETPNLEGETPLELGLEKNGIREVFAKYVESLDEKISFLKISNNDEY
ncbi:nuclear factor NF-kappa-B p105 subunit-like [Neocloeon triangulifer]|uniref:nuclear factor NF-kappa-B p105 subunit-like n=1 Tax=Neocloeon triangulifer TaxID=2078957 RepID=UPI00286F0F03|nr:nuclear factor NF-kappa-B p105 subunit-like [Neocloeon triangulifer]XP_059475192.1 nuclear factor NF-kappa-B p105 subunit-like [Neocloeon triangulifer]